MDEKTSERTVREEMNFVGQGETGIQPVRLVTELKRFTFKNIGKSMFHVTPLHTKNTKTLKPGEMRDDFTSKDRAKILTSTLYQLGQVVEILPEDAYPNPEDRNPNALDDKQLDTLLLSDNSEIRDHIVLMDSVFAVDRMREKLVERDMPAHLVGYCDSRISELKSKYEEEKKAPVDAYKGGT